MSLVQLTNDEKVLVDVIVSTGHVPQTVTVHSSDYLTHRDTLDIEEFISNNSDQRSRTFINNILRENK